ncbi:MAG: TIGR03663 family protein [Opitutaceae bacterium]|nr:TIGR03663 family protein [Opitutaceae bacterium]
MLPLFLRWLPLALIALGSLWLRTHELGQRPMHADEANQGVKLGELLDTGRYAFDPRDHHGPTLYYAALPVAWLRGERSLATLTETTVRLVPAIFGTVAVLLIAALAAPLGRWPSLAAALFFAVSPPVVYYARDFIQETLLLTFVLAVFLSVRTWWRTGLARWAVVAGLCAGLAQATKASAPLFLAIALGALLLTRGDARPASRRPRRDLAAGVLAALATAALLYSSFGTHFAGLRDALGAYAHAATRFGADAAPTGHEKPWLYYLRLFGWWREGGLVWHQVAFSFLAIAGLGAALAQRDRFLRGVALYTVLVVAAFSFFAYKTPWHAIHFVPGLTLLAATTVAALSRLPTGRLLAVAFALITVSTLFQQTGRSSFLRPADQRNPYAYVHSSPDVRKFRPLADAALARAPDQPVRVVAEEYWPLPWYFRGLPRVGFYAAPPDDCDGALIVASLAQAEAVRAKLSHTYRESILGLRPGVLLIVFTPEP